MYKVSSLLCLRYKTDFRGARPEMGKALIDQSPLFEKVLSKCDQSLASLPDPPLWSVIDEIRRPPASSNIHKSLYSQTVCTALQLGIVVLLRSWGISPIAVIGHSSGEIAAAYTAGLLSLENAIIVAYYRGLFLDCSTLDGGRMPEGSMCAVSMNRKNVLQLLGQYGGRVQLAAVNSHNSCTLSGDADAIKEIEEDCLQRNIFCRKLFVDKGQQLVSPLDHFADQLK